MEASYIVPRSISTPFCTNISQNIIKKNGSSEAYIWGKIAARITRIKDRYTLSCVDLLCIKKEFERTLYSGITTDIINKALVLSVCTLIESDPEYSTLASQLLIEQCIKNLSRLPSIKDDFSYEHAYRDAFISGMHKGIAKSLFHEKMKVYDLTDLAATLDLSRDILFEYTGIHTFCERYFTKDNGVSIETPQGFWMRVAMGLALMENKPQERAKEFYDILSRMKYTSSTPTLFHSGFPIAQLSSCYLNISNDDLTHIFKTFGDNAQLSKWAGGIGTSWSSIRGSGSFIKGIRSSSQGVIPYLKIADDIIGAITKAGIRRGGKVAYLEVWHYDVEDFIDLRRNTGDHRRRTHEMNTALWICDLFMKRIEEDDVWTLFSSNETPDLHELYGKKFEEAYLKYEEQSANGTIKIFKTIKARDLWRKILTSLFSTGHPWITFKDPSNIRSPQDHCGVIHSSNLCTEITLNTSEQETAVCNLGSINCSRFVVNGAVDYEGIKKTIRTAVRALDNVIDLNFYPIKEAQDSNMKHRPIGLGIMGWQDMLYQLNIPFNSEAARLLCDELMEYISFHAIETSSDLAAERGCYQSFKGSKWDRGIFPFDTLALVEEERGRQILVNRATRLDWNSLKEKVARQGMRNSNLMAIAPTATISTITGSFPSIEPAYKNLYVKANVSGEFTIINKYLVNDLKKINLWNQDIIDKIKFFDGSIQSIDEIPHTIKELYKTAFEIKQDLLIEMTALRSKWIDQSQSHNIFFQGSSGKDLEKIYLTAWNYGLKTTYYPRTLGATQIEKSTLDAQKFGFTQLRSKSSSSCDLSAGCESCQ